MPTSRNKQTKQPDAKARQDEKSKQAKPGQKTETTRKR